jgi:hypothetical protein
VPKSKKRHKIKEGAAIGQRRAKENIYRVMVETDQEEKKKLEMLHEDLAVTKGSNHSYFEMTENGSRYSLI